MREIVNHYILGGEKQMFNVAIMMIVMGIGLLIICEHDKKVMKQWALRLEALVRKKLLVLPFFLYLKGGQINVRWLSWRS